MLFISSNLDNIEERKTVYTFPTQKHADYW